MLCVILFQILRACSFLSFMMFNALVILWNNLIGVVMKPLLTLLISEKQVAGAAAASGLSLAEVAAEAKRASEMVGTMGVALSVCTLPGHVCPDRLGPGKMELGLGIVSTTL